MSENAITHRNDKGVDIYHFKRVNRSAIDEFYTIAMPIFKIHVEQYQDTVPICYVFDLSDSGMFQVRYMMNKAIEEISNFDYHPTHYVAYVITNIHDKMLIDILEQLTTRNLAHTRKVFKPHELSEAVSWLQGIRATFIE